LDVGNHSLESLKNSKTKDPIVNLAILLHDVGKPIVARKQKDGVITFYNHELLGASIARNIAQRLKLSKKEEEKLIILVRWHQFSVDEKQTEKAIRRFIKNVGKQNLEDMLVLRTADRLGGGARETSWRMELFKKKLIEVQKQPFLITDLKISGNDIMKELKINTGPLIGRFLKTKRDYQVTQINYFFFEVSKTNLVVFFKFFWSRIKAPKPKAVKTNPTKPLRNKIVPKT
jgi:hypothetical protein